MSDQTEQKPLPHLADLHARAQELGIDGFRGMRKEDLAREIERRGSGRTGKGPGILARLAGLFKRSEGSPEKAQKGRGKSRSKDSGGSQDGFEVEGVFDRMPRGYGFVRLEKGSKSDQDSYISPSQIRRCKLKPGDQVKGLARDPRKGERHRAMVRVTEVNGKPL